MRKRCRVFQLGWKKSITRYFKHNPNKHECVWRYLRSGSAYLQLFSADPPAATTGPGGFYNPISQFIFRVCAPVVEALGKLFPPWGTLNNRTDRHLIQWSVYLIFGLIQGVPMLSSSLSSAGLQSSVYPGGNLFLRYFYYRHLQLVGTAGHPPVRLVSQIVDLSWALPQSYSAYGYDGFFTYSGHYQPDCYSQFRVANDRRVY